MKKTIITLGLVFGVAICNLVSEELEVVNPRFKFDVDDKPIAKKLIEIGNVKGWTASTYTRNRLILEVNSAEDPNPDKNSVVLNKGEFIKQTLSHPIEGSCTYVMYIEGRWFGSMDETEGEITLSFFYLDENEKEIEVATNTLTIKPVVRKDFCLSFSALPSGVYLGKSLGIKIAAPKAWVQLYGVTVSKQKE